MKSTLRLNAKIFPIIGALAFIMQIMDPSRVWVILLIGIGGTWLFCWWWVRGLARALTFEREMRYGWAQVGDRLEERFTLNNQFVLPATSITVQDHSTLPDHHASIATGVDGSSTAQWKILSQCTRRGVYTLGGTTLETGDPLGIYTLTLEDTNSSTLAIMPPVVALPRFHILSSGWAGEGKTIRVRSRRRLTPHTRVRWYPVTPCVGSIGRARRSKINSLSVSSKGRLPVIGGCCLTLIKIHSAAQAGTQL